jgi:hypothetical protein
MKLTCYRSIKCSYIRNIRVKWTSEPQTIKNLRLSFFISHQKLFYCKKFTTQQMSLEVFKANFLTSSHENESHKIWILRRFDVHFTYFYVWNFICQIYGVIRPAKRSKKFPIFSTVDDGNGIQVFHVFTRKLIFYTVIQNFGFPLPKHSGRQLLRKFRVQNFYLKLRVSEPKLRVF